MIYNYNFDYYFIFTENHMNRINTLFKKSENELQNYAADAKTAFGKAIKDIKACDSDTHIKHQTYVEINGPSQGFIFDSSEVNPRSNCESFNNERDKCEKDSETCFQHTCTTSGGILKNCQRISQKNLKICPAVSDNFSF